MCWRCEESAGGAVVWASSLVVFEGILVEGCVSVCLGVSRSVSVCVSVFFISGSRTAESQSTRTKKLRIKTTTMHSKMKNEASSDTGR